MKLRICTKCKPNHYENCPKCFGFGVRKAINSFGEHVPIIADESSNPPNDWIKCSYCKSTPRGLPTNED